MHARIAAGLVTTLVCATPASSINVVVDYRYDSNNFFPAGSQQRATLEAAAQRFSDIITTSLSEAQLLDNSQDPRIGFSHPGNGLSWDVSPASSSGTDALSGNPANIAEEYRGPWTIAEDDWILYAGGRSISSAGIGGTGTGLNFTSVFNDGGSHLNRGFRSSGGVSNLPVWGGAITFDTTGINWHFGLETAAPSGTVDFYSIALHEIGHALGLSTSWDEWDDQGPGSLYEGANALAAYNADNGTSLTSLSQVSSGNPHWADGIYESDIFAAGGPNLAGTVGLGNPQDLLMEPTANFIFPSQRRFELTNVDVAALEDLGWTVIDNVASLPGDYDFDGDVDAADYVVWRDNLGTPEAFGTFAEWSANYGATAASTSVPEPGAAVLAALAAALVCGRRGAGASGGR